METTPFKHQTKTQALSAHITEMARRLGPNQRLPTMQELCTMTGVSIVTLNRALSELEAQHVIYRKHGVGIFVAAELAQHTVGLVYDRDIFSLSVSPFGKLLVDRARQRAEAKSEKFSFYLSVPSQGGLPVHEDLVEALNARRLQGIIFVGETNPAAVTWLLKQNVPLVAVAYTPIAPHRVKIDHAEGVKLGVQALAKQGCKRIGLWIPVGVGVGRAAGARSFPELDSYKQALKKANLEYLPELVWRSAELTDALDGGESPQEQGLRAGREVLGSPPAERPDGVMILDDTMTRGALATMQHLGLRIGKDLRIATQTNADSPVLMGYENDLTLLDVDLQELVSGVFEILEALMAGNEPAQAIVSVKPKLRVA